MKKFIQSGVTALVSAYTYCLLLAYGTNVIILTVLTALIALGTYTATVAVEIFVEGFKEGVKHGYLRRKKKEEEK